MFPDFIYPHEFQEFCQKIAQLNQILKLPIVGLGAELEIDHCALRVNGEDKAYKFLEILQTRGKILSHKEINGRPIYLIELYEPLVILEQKVAVVELPFPKKNYSQEGWEHVEVVIPPLADESPAQWQARVLATYGWEDDQQIQIKISQPQAEGEQLPNPSIALSLEKFSQNSKVIKVHPYSIKQVVESEIYTKK